MIEVSRFWRDHALPFVEARRVGDGRQVCYAAHSHESFSIGVITGGRSTYLNGDLRIQVGAGTTVLMNRVLCMPATPSTLSLVLPDAVRRYVLATGARL